MLRNPRGLLDPCAGEVDHEWAAVDEARCLVEVDIVQHVKHILREPENLSLGEEEKDSYLEEGYS